MVDFEKLMKQPSKPTVWVECPKCHSRFTDLYISQHVERCNGMAEAF